MFGKQLAKLRKKKGLSQYELAEKLGFSRGQIANYEQGKREPDFETLQKIADYFEESIDFLLTGRENAKENKDKNLFFFDMEGLTEEEIEDIKQHIEYVKWKANQRGKENE